MFLTVWRAGLQFWFQKVTYTEAGVDIQYSVAWFLNTGTDKFKFRSVSLTTVIYFFHTPAN